MKITPLIICIFIISCNSPKLKYIEVKTKNATNKKEFKIVQGVPLFNTDNIHINKSNTFSTLNIDYYLYCQDSILILYNITKKVVVDYYKIHSEMKEFGDISSIILHNLDSIFIVQFNRIALISKKKVINTWNINTDTESRNCIDNLDNSELYFDNKSNTLILEQYCCSCDFDSVNYFKTSPIAYFNIKNNSYSSPNIHYSKKYFEGYYGFWNKVFISNDVSNTYLSYAIDPNIYILDRHTNTQKIIGGKSKFQKKDALKLDEKYISNNHSEKKMQHLTLCHYYSGIIIDKYRGLYYRFYFDDLPLKNENGLYSKYSDKQMVLMVFNKNWELLKELPFEKENKLNPFFTFVTKNGLYIKESNSNLFTQIKINE